MLGRIAVWTRDRLGADSPWHITKFFPAYKLSYLPATASETLWWAYDAARAVSLRNVYVYDDKGCDCAGENLPVAVYLAQGPAQVHAVKKCAASCCGGEDVLLKKYEQRLDSRDQSAGDR